MQSMGIDEKDIVFNDSKSATVLAVATAAVKRNRANATGGPAGTTGTGPGGKGNEATSPGAIAYGAAAANYAKGAAAKANEKKG